VSHGTDTRRLLVEARATIVGWLDRASTTAARHPLGLVALLATTLQAYAAYRTYAPLAAGEWPRLRDSVIFEYIGWNLAEGSRLYIDLWEIKPPLAFEVTGLLAVVSGGSVTTYHTLNLLVTSGAVVASAVASAAIIEDLTGDSLGAVVGGVAVFTLPAYYWRALVGFKSKYFVVLCGLLVIWLALRDRPILAGAAGVAAVGFWQLAVAVPVIGFLMTLQRGRRYDAAGFLAGGVAFGAVMLLPVVLWGATEAMIAEAVLAPILVSDGGSMGGHARLAFRLLGKTIPIAVLGVAGYAGSLTGRRLSREWPLLAGVGWFTFVVLFIDLDAAPDLFPWFALLALGVGLAIGRGDGHARRVLSAAVLAMVLLSVLTMGGFGAGDPGLPGTGTYDTAAELSPHVPFNGTDQQYMFWNDVEPPSCRVFAGRTQTRLIKRANLVAPTEAHWNVPCGRLAPVWDAVVDTFA